MSNILYHEGYQISFAANGKQALSVSQAIMPDLILLDIMMPEMDGFECAKRLKDNDMTKDIPVIFLTGRAETQDIVKGFSYGAVDYITKPFNSVELISRVKTHLELKFTKDRMLSYTIKLKEYQQELKQVIASKDKFFSIIAHDLRGPFSGFIGLSEILSNKYDEINKEEVAEIGRSLNESAKNLFNLLENLLEWSSTQLGRINYNPLNHDISGIVNKIVGLLNISAKEKNIEFEYKIPSNTFVYCDSNMVHTVFRNLISNAIKFTENGKIILDIIELDEKYYQINIQDTGIGISSNSLTKIFKLENKFTTPGTRRESGTGLGLILCKEFVERNSGKIWVESELGKGTTFSFTLPKIFRND